MTIEKY